MKQLFLFLFIFSFVNMLLSQTNEKKAMVKERVTKTTSYLVANDLETFKNQFEDWNVGNLHIYSRKNSTADYDYYFTGKKISHYFQQYFPKTMKNSLIQEGKEPYHVASIRGHLLNDYYILRINDGKSKNVIVLYNLENEQLNPKRTLAYFYEKEGQTYQMDSWLKDINGDTRIDLIQKTRATDAKGNIIKEKTKVFFQTRKGKFKRTKKIKIDKNNYKLETIN